MWVIGIWSYVCDRVHDDDIVILSFLGYSVFHHGHFLRGGKLLMFLLTLNIDMKSEDPDTWLRPQAVQMDAGSLKAVEFSSFYL